MDKHRNSFIGRHRWRANNNNNNHLESSPRSSSFSPHHKSPVVVPIDPADHLQSSDDEDDELPDDLDHHQIITDLDALLSAEDNPELPDHIIHAFSIIVMSKTKKTSPVVADHKHDDNNDEDETFLYESVQRLSKMKTAANIDEKLVGKLLQRIMMFMGEQLRTLLLVDVPAPDQPKLKVISTKHFSFKTERCPPALPPPEPASKQEDYPGFSEQDINKINKIVRTMISAGYKNECSNVYSIARGNALYEQLRRLDFEKLNAEDVQKLNWDWLEQDLSRWIRIIKHFSKFLIPAERKLGQTVFSDDHFHIFRGLFVNLTRSLITSLLDYAAAVAMMKRSAERLFKFLDMYEALNGLRESMNGDDPPPDNDLNVEISSVAERIGEGVVNMFGDLEKSIRQDAAKTPVPGGAVHPLTRYVLNYLKYACDYGDTLDQIFQQNAKLNPLLQVPATTSSMSLSSEDIDMEKSPLAAQIASVMSLLDGNLAVKSTLYKDPSLRDIFMMNNGRYILQKVKGSGEIKKLMGDTWCRRRSSEVRHYHKSYQRETWARLLQCITQEGIQVNGKVNKRVLKERFKNFNGMFDEIHKTQSGWVVSEEQLQSELRASISAVVIPAYRSFVGRYKHHFEKNVDKYIKYQPEDIEALIETLFEGNPPTSMSRKRF
ncbi:hypothetical protein SSX86_007209 [Deinandra increscens subsp. villosa]|uniref:Exocyst subunit Exo70 family protein n=1 Tax=Deinandra increscens subsp. villosa TaxID=3103831 RepID=A0AAP0H7A0_9ASTR